jgi:hypothetical protein
MNCQLIIILVVVFVIICLFQISPGNIEERRCYYCDHGIYPEGRMVDPTTDKDAHKTSRGDWMGRVSTTRDLYEMNRGS